MYPSIGLIAVDMDIGAMIESMNLSSQLSLSTPSFTATPPQMNTVITVLTC